MKKHPLIFVCFIALLFAIGNAANAFAESNSKGPDAPVVVGVIMAVEGKVITVKAGSIERKLTLTAKTAISYLDISDKAKQTPTVGYLIKGNTVEGVLTSAIFSPPMGPKVEMGPEKLTMSIEELFNKTDADKNGQLTYGEYSAAIHYSEKHGPSTFKKIDGNHDGCLNTSEFSEILKSVDWWRLSRKPPADYFTAADGDKNGILSVKEFFVICPGSHTDANFQRCDLDKSGGLDKKETLTYINKVIAE